MTDRASFLRAICENPDDDDLRLVSSPWLRCRHEEREWYQSHDLLALPFASRSLLDREDVPLDADHLVARLLGVLLRLRRREGEVVHLFHVVVQQQRHRAALLLGVDVPLRADELVPGVLRVLL